MGDRWYLWGGRIEAECTAVLTPRVRKGSEGSNPSLPAAQLPVDQYQVANCDMAWAAGLFEGEGTVCGYVPRHRRAKTVQVTVYQGAQDGPPRLLDRFRDTVGCGEIMGPYRGRLYHWTTKRIASVEATCSALWPDLSPERQAQFIRAFSGSARWERFCRDITETSTPPPHTRRRELAWAAGFFDAEGSVMTSAYPRLELAQASETGAPHSSLLRFHQAVLCLGRVTGPRSLNNAWSRLPQFRWEASSFEAVQAVLALLWNDLGPGKRADARRAFAARSVGRAVSRGSRAHMMPVPES
jgi:hypothetical protein